MASDLKLLNDNPKPTKAEPAAVFSIKSLLFIFVLFGNYSSVMRMSLITGIVSTSLK